MRSISYKRHRFPADVIRQAVWLYFRFTMSFRDVEDLLAEQGIEVSYETIRCWAIKFGPAFTRELSDECAQISVSRISIFDHGGSSHEAAPLGQRG